LLRLAACVGTHDLIEVLDAFDELGQRPLVAVALDGDVSRTPPGTLEKVSCRLSACAIGAGCNAA
jgi:hypothetical protein